MCIKMDLVVVCIFAELLGNVVGDRAGRFVADEMDFEAEITLLKKQMAQQTATLATQTSEITQLRQQVTHFENSKGTTYIRWGKSTCGGLGTSTVYSGYMAGTYVDSSNGGSGANYLCLPTQPTWDHYTNTVDNHILVTGVEYSFSPHYTSDISDFFGSNIHGAEAPCAVCHVERGASIMIPGRNECYGSWTQEYQGYLVTGYPLYDDSTEFVCLDRRPESVTNSGAIHDKNNLYFVEAKCGYDLECPPYVSGREMSCVVCSK